MSDVEDSSTEAEVSSATERTELLPRTEDPGANYTLGASQAQLEARSGRADGEGGAQEETANLEGEGSPRSSERQARRRSGEGNVNTNEEEEEEEEAATSCGLVDCLGSCVKGFLNLLPSVGDVEEGQSSEAAEAALRFGAKQIIMLIVPVTICMAVVVLFELSVAIKQPNDTYFIYTPFDENDTSSGGETFLFALLNALIVVAIVIVMTVVLVCLFKYRCYRAIQGWLLLASGSLLFVFSSLYFTDILLVHNLPIDWFSFALYLWNFGVVGLIVIHWKGPLKLQQAYLILISALVATRFLKYLPDWTTWLLLAAISVYDLFAVLCPKGPLRVLVETARERNQPLFPSLIYSSTMVWIIGMADTDDRKPSSGASGSGQASRKGSTSKGSTDGKESSSGSEVDTDTDTDRQIAARDMGQSVEHPDRRAARVRERTRVAGQTEGRDDGVAGQREQPEGGDDEESEEEEPRGFKLGLGDFIFYSILVGKAAHDSEGDWTIIASCFVAILIGLCVTSLILGIVRRALPALPISIFFGLIFYFSSFFLISPFASVLATTQVFI